jgi:hypothetical protein
MTIFNPPLGHQHMLRLRHGRRAACVSDGDHRGRDSVRWGRVPYADALLPIVAGTGLRRRGTGTMLSTRLGLCWKCPAACCPGAICTVNDMDRGVT